MGGLGARVGVPGEVLWDLISSLAQALPCVSPRGWESLRGREGKERKGKGEEDELKVVFDT